MQPVKRLLFQSLLGRRLPRHSGRLRVEGLIAPVQVGRDEWGVPYIEAGNDHDAWFALGFCQGQDRAFQIETRLRVVRGTMAELIGKDGLAIDRISRAIGFYRSALQQLPALLPEEKELIEAFARGVTAGATVGARRLAHEFALTRSRPTPYTAADVLGLLKLVSFLLASNWDLELARACIAQEDGAEALYAIDPIARHAGLDAAELHEAPLKTAVQSIYRDLRAFFSATGRGGASNNWAVGPSKTRTGRPIVANDPHLTPGLPPHWYLAHIRTPDWRAVGAALAGAPGIVVGHNGYVAWGVTAGLLDNTDLFIEEIGPDGASVRRGDRFVPCEVREEVVRVRGRGQGVTLRFVRSDFGPVLTPAAGGGNFGLAVRATWLDALPVVGFLRAHRATSGEELRGIFEAWPSLPLNLVYADAKGSVGWQMVGRAPVRRRGWGVAPAPAWEEGAGWNVDPVPYGQMPRAVDPPQGVVVTANSKPEGDWPFLGFDWLEEYRKHRILEVLLEKDDWDVQATLRLQTDVQSLPWRSLRPVLARLSPGDPDARLALELLLTWDGRVDAVSSGATVFEAFIAAMAKHAYRRKARQASGLAVAAYAGTLASRMIQLLCERPPGWFERPWEAEMEEVLAEVVRALRERFGDRPENWAWGRVRPLVLQHPAGRGVLAGVYNRGPFLLGGDTNTVAQGGVDSADVFQGPLAIPSLRAVMEVGAWDEARFVLPGGQSGNPCSPHYDDMLSLWLAGEAVVIPWSDEAVRAKVRKKLALLPKVAVGRRQEIA